MVRKNRAATTEAERIVIEADPDAPAGSVVLEGARKLCTQGYAILIQQSKFITIRGLTITGAGGQAISLLGGNNQNTAIHLERNRIVGNGGLECDGGITVSRGNPELLISHNLIYGNGRNGLTFIDATGGPHYVFNNTIIGNRWNGVRVTRAHAVTFLFNNLIARNGVGTGVTGGRFGVVRENTTKPDPAGLLLLNNLICGNKSGELNGPALDATDLHNLTPTGQEGSGVQASPTCGQPDVLFTDVLGADDKADTLDDDFTLASTSPAVDAGTDPRSPPLTFPLPNELLEADYQQDHARPRDGDGNGTAEFDIGAYESAGRQCVPKTTEACYDGPPETKGVGVCHAGTRTCQEDGTWGQCDGQVLPALEVCNGLDEDCDRASDEDLGQTTCGIGACQVTVDNCANGHPQTCTPGEPTLEICGNGIDEDCTGVDLPCPPNHAPRAVDDAYETLAGREFVVAKPGVLVNDSDDDHDPLTAKLHTNPTHGTLTLNTDGSFTYTPAAGFSGDDAFTYNANDGKEDSTNAATVKLTVKKENHAPIVQDDTYNVRVGKTLEVPAPGVLGNDSDADSDVLTAHLVTGPVSGSLTLNTDGSFSYTPPALPPPPPPLCLTDPNAPPGGVSGATIQTFISLGINPQLTCIENTLWVDPLGFRLGAYVKGAELMGGTPDPKGFNFDYSTVDGTLAGNANNRDFFWVQDNGNGVNFGGGVSGGAPSKGIVWDLGGQANQAVIFVQVDHGPLPGEVLENSVWLSNDPDAADAGWTQALLEHVYLQGWSPDPNVADGFVAVYRLPTNQTFRYVSVTWGGPGAVLRDGDNEIDAVSGLTAEGFGVGESFTYTASDGKLDSPPATVKITIQPNHAPHITSTPITETTASQPYTYDVDATDQDNDTLTYSLMTAPAGMTIDPASGVISWNPTNTDAGDHPVKVTVSDGHGGSDMQSFSLKVIVSQPSNHPPDIVSAPVLTATVGKLYTYDVDATDPDVGDTLTYSLTTKPDGMTIDSSTGVIEWTPTAGQTPMQDVEVKVEDGHNGSDMQSFPVAVTASINHAPVAVDDAYDTTQTGQLLLDFDDGQLPSTKGWTYKSDCAKDFSGGVDLSESQAFHTTNGLLNLNTTGHSTSLVSAWYQLLDTIDPARSQVFEARLRVLATEAASPSVTQAFILSIVVAERHLVLQIGDGEVKTFDAGQGGVSAPVDTSVFHTYAITKPPGAGTSYTVLVDGVPVLTGTALIETKPPYLGLNRLVFGDGTCQARNGKVEIDFVRFRQFAENDALTIPAPGVLANDSDQDSDPLSSILVNEPAHGAVTLNPDGSLLYTPNAGFEGTDSFTYKANDGALDSNVATVHIVVGLPHPPTITSTPTTARWEQLAPTGTPPVPRYAASLHTYDEVNDRLIAFGGQTANVVVLNEVWVLSHASGLGGTPAWTKLEPTGTAPSPRSHFASGYDPTANRLIVYGGCLGPSCPETSDAWVLTHANGLGGQPEWLPLPSSNTLAYGVGGYDPISNRLVVFGGLPGAAGSDTTEVKVLLDANGIGAPSWVPLSPVGTRPPPRGQSQPGVYDPLSNTLIIFGGQSSGNIVTYNEVWVLSHANGLGGVPTWTQLNPMGLAPIPRRLHTMAYDPNSNRLIVSGGHDPVQNSRLNDTWVLTHANGQGGTPEWIKLAPSSLPAVGSTSTAGYARSSNRLVAALGISTTETVLNDVWVLANANGQCTAGQPCNYDVDATDPDAGDTLTFSLDTAPTGMTIDPSTGLIDWTPTPEQIGDHNVQVRVTDPSGLFATQSFTLTVAPVVVPNVVGLDPASAEALIGAADLTVGTETHTGGEIKLNFDTLPSQQGWKYVTPGNSVLEASVFSLSGTSLLQNTLGIGGRAAWYEMLNGVDSRLPMSVQVRARIVEENGGTRPYGFCFDTYTDTELFSTGLGLNVIADANLNTVPFDNTQFHQYRMNVIPGDVQRLMVDGQLVQTGKPRPTAIFGGIPNQILFGDCTENTNARAEITAYSFTQPRITSQNPPAGTLVPNKSDVDLTIQDGPATATVPNVVGLTRTAAEAAIVDAKLTVGTVITANSDTVPAGKVISQSPVAGIAVVPGTAVNLVVSLGPINGNHPPTVTSTAILTATKEHLYSYDVDATDPDVGDVLTFSLTTKPDGMIINPSTGLIQWTPTAGQVGDNPVTARVTDTGGLFAEQSFTVTVKVTNTAPVADAGLLGAPGLPACVAPPGGLVSWYPGDGNSTDIIGPNSPTSTVGTPQFVAGKVGQGIRFDGNSGLIVPNNATIDFGKADSFSIDAWVRVEGVTGVGDNMIVDKKTDLPLNRGYGLHALVLSFSPSGTTRFAITIQEDHSRIIYGQATTRPAPLGEFHHVVGVIDRTKQTIAIYLNGVLEQELSIANVGDIAGGAQLSLGRHNVSPESPLVGTVDELEIFNRALSQTEIQSLFLAGSAGKCKIRPGETVALDGAQSTDPDSDRLSYHWTLLTKPDGSTAALSNADVAQPTFVADKPGTYRVQLVVNDGTVDSAPSAIAIGVLDANRPSIALDDLYTTTLGETLNVSAPGVIANDHDADGDPLTATKLTDPPHGTLSFNSNGSFAYTPDAGVDGPGSTAHTVIATIYPDGAPKAFALNPTTNRLYVSDIFGNTVPVIDGASNKIIAVVPSPHSYVEDVAVNPVTNRIYLSGTQLSNYTPGGGTPQSNEVTVINGATNTVLTEIAVGHQPQDVAVNPSTNRIYVANVDDHTVSVINGATNTVIATVPVGANPRQIGVNSDTNRVYVLSADDATVSVIDGATNAVLATISVGSDPRALVVDRVLNRLYTANFASDSVSVIDGTSDMVMTTIPVGDGPQALALNDVTGRLYVTNFTGNTVSVIDTATNLTVGAAIPVGVGPYAITVNPLTHRIYVANQTGNTLSVIDEGSAAVTATVPVGANPANVSVNPLTDQVYTANFDAHSISVVHVGDHFTYKVSDEQLDSNAADVTIVIEPGPLAPVAEHDVYTTNTGSTLTVSAPGILSNDGDANGDTLTATLGSNPAHGSLTLNPNGSFTYTPTAGFSGTDTFTYKANDGVLDSNTATVTITVAGGSGQNHAPIAVDDAYDTTQTGQILLDFDDGQLPSTKGWRYQSDCRRDFPSGVDLPEDQTFNVANGLLHIDTTAPTTTFVSAYYDRFNIIDPTLTQVFEARLRVLTEEPAPPASKEVFALFLTCGNCTGTTFSILRVGDGEVSTFEPDQGGSSAAVDTSIFHTYTLLRLAGSQGGYTVLVDGVPVLTGTAVGLGGGNRLVFGDGTCQSRNGSADIDFVRFRQFADGASLTIPAPGVLGNDSDADGDALTAKLANGPTHGTVTLNTDGSLTYTPASNFTGIDSFTYTANDGKVDSNTATVTITVGLADHPPQITSTPVTTATVGQLYSYDVEAIDPDGDPFTFSLTTAPTGMTIDPMTGIIQWTPTVGQGGDNAVTVKVQDPAGQFAEQSFTIKVATPGQTVVVPDVIGKTQTAATTTLTNAKLGVGHVTPVDTTIPLSFSSLPSTQGWGYGALGNSASEAQVFSLSNDVLQQNTIGLGVTEGRNVYQRATGVLAALPFALTVTARVLQEEGDATDAFGFGFSVAISAERFAFGLRTNGIHGPVGNLLSTAIDTAQFHEYRMEGAPGLGFRLFVDGLLIGSSAAGVGSPAPVSFISIGDLSDTANARGEIKGFSFVQGAGLVIDQNPDAGAVVSQGSLVDLTVAKAAESVTVPSVVGQTEADAISTLLTAKLLVGDMSEEFSATVPQGSVISQNPVADTVVPEQAAVDLKISRGPPQGAVPNVVGLTQAAAEAAILAAGFTVGSISTAPHPTIPAGSVTSQSPAAGAFATPGSPVSFVVSLGPDTSTLCPLSSILVQPDNPLILVGQTQAFTAIGMCTDGTSQNLNGQVTWFSSNTTVATIDNTGIASGIADGTTTISASLSGLTGSTTLTIRPVASSDTAFPTAEISAPADNATITTLTDVTGTATDTNFFKYVLEYAPVGTNTFTELKTGTSPVTSGLLGKFDPTLLINDLYTLRLTVYDRANKTTTTEVRVQVDREQKVGNFTLAFQDVSIPMACLPITVTRTYDSRDKQKGDFGIGWRLDVNTIRLRESSRDEDGKDWRQEQIDKPGPFGTTIPTFVLTADDLHKVSLTLPDGKVEEFDLTPQPSESQLVPIVNTTAVYTPRPGTLGSLAVPAAQWNLIVSGNGELLNKDFEALYDPPTFLYTTPDGTTFTIHRTNGVQQVQCTNGQTLTFGHEGITHSADKGVTFERDAQGRITKIIDPNGKVRQYAYNANGDLVSYLDPENNLTKFTYNFRHGMLDIVDPRGVRAIRNEYDADGRLISSTDADGKPITYTHDLATRTETVTDRLGNPTIFKYDDKGNVLEQIDALGHSTKFTYDAFGNEETRTDPLNRTTTRTFDTKRNVLSEEDPLHHTTSYTYTALNAVKTITDPLNRVTTNNYDTKGNLTSTTDPLGKSTTYTYDTGGVIIQGAGNLLSTTDALNHTTHYEYDTFGNVKKETDPTGHMTTYTYDANGNRITQTTTRTTETGIETLTTTFTYDALNRLTKTTYPDNSTTQTIYNAIGKQAKTLDQLGRETSYEYDNQGRLKSTTYPDGTSESSTYDDEGRRKTSTDRGGRVTSYEYDALGRLTKTIHPDGAMEKTKYDAAGQVEETTDALGHVTKYEYDAAGRRKKVIDALTHATLFTYDAVGNQKTVTNANGHTTLYVYDDNNRRTRVTYPDGTEEKTDYDALGRTIKKTDQAGKMTQFEYDELDRLKKVIDALGQETKYTYDEMGNQLTQTDANNHTTSFAYDQLGRRIKRTLPLGQFETSVYDAVGNLTSKTDFNGKATTYEYDLVNRLEKKTPDPSLNEPPVMSTYTATGQRESMTDASGTTAYTYDSRDRLTQKATPQGTLLYTYDDAGNLLSMHSSHVDGVSVNYEYDVLNRLQKVIDHRQGDAVTTYAYDNVGNLDHYDYPNGVTHQYTYNNLNRLTDLTVGKVASPTLASYIYDLGPAGNRTAVTEKSGRKASYTYDDLYRLKEETIANDTAGVNGTIGYVYDPVGNRKTRTSTVPGITNQTFTYDNNDRLNTDTYDDNGNTVGSDSKTYDYDYENHLTNQNGNGVVILYDGDGNRVSKTVGGVTTQYLVDDRNHTGYAQVVEEIVNNVVARQYTYGLDLISQNQGSGISYYGYDGHGSVRLLTDETGAKTDTYDYDAFGNLIHSAGSTPNNYLYTGEQLDPNVGFYYLRARYLSQSAGRFISSDPIEGHILQPASLHDMVYAENNPVNKNDPGGTFALYLDLVISTALRPLVTQPYAEQTALFTRACRNSRILSPYCPLRDPEPTTRFTLEMPIDFSVTAGPLALTITFVKIAPKTAKNESRRLLFTALGGSIPLIPPLSTTFTSTGSSSSSSVDFTTTVPMRPRDFEGIGWMLGVSAALVGGASYSCIIFEASHFPDVGVCGGGSGVLGFTPPSITGVYGIWTYIGF